MIMIMTWHYAISVSHKIKVINIINMMRVFWTELYTSVSYLSCLSCCSDSTAQCIYILSCYWICVPFLSYDYDCDYDTMSTPGLNKAVSYFPSQAVLLMLLPLKASWHALYCHTMLPSVKLSWNHYQDHRHGYHLWVPSLVKQLSTNKMVF